MQMGALPIVFAKTPARRMIFPVISVRNSYSKLIPAINSTAPSGQI
jgi:hypothetical protein